MELLFHALGYIGALIVGYAAIRADLARLHEKAANAQAAAAHAHERIDNIFEHGRCPIRPT